MKSVIIVCLCCLTGLSLQTQHDNVPEGQVSLAFVFDTTGSMSDDLQQAILGATKILNTTLALPNQPLYNYILVPFNDPAIGPVFETRDPVEFQQRLSAITVDGGKDCPEMCIGAIYKAVNVCLSHSYIYVFTDASAKDYSLTDSVLALNQRKQSKIVFSLTGDCGDHGETGRQVYDRIADISSGQVFSIQKSTIDEVLEYVKNDIRTDKVNLVSTNTKDDNSTLMLPVDSKLTEITISVNGKNPSLNVTDASGHQVRDMKTLLDIDTALIVKVKNPTPGKLRVDIRSDGPHSVRVTGQTSSDFAVVIKAKYLVTVNGTEHELLTGYSAYMYIEVFVNGTDFHPPAGFSEIELLNVNGTFITEYNLTRSALEPREYKTMPFVPPVGYFYVKVIGTDEGGYKINRMMSAAITGLMPEKPVLRMPDVIQSCKGSETILTCHVESLIPYSVRWYKQDKQLGNETYFKLSANATLKIPGVCKSDSGNYVCNATNSAGSVMLSTLLNVSTCESMPVLETPTCETCSCPPPVERKCNCSSTEGREQKQIKNDAGADTSKFGIGIAIGAGIILIVETSAILVYNKARKIKLDKLEQTYGSKNDDFRTVAMLNEAYNPR